MVRCGVLLAASSCSLMVEEVSWLGVKSEGHREPPGPPKSREEKPFQLLRGLSVTFGRAALTVLHFGVSKWRSASNDSGKRPSHFLRPVGESEQHVIHTGKPVIHPPEKGGCHRI